MDTVSVITATYNAAATLERALDSVRSQAWAPIEHIVVDGGSGDGTLDILRQRPGVTWVSGKDRGIYDAINKGIASSSGEWLYVLGADDYLVDEQVFADMLGAESCRACDVVYGNVISPRCASPYGGAFNLHMILTRNICHQSIFMRRRLFDRIGPYDLRYRYFADWDLNLRWFLDPTVARLHVDRVVAYFNDGGVSTQNDDTLFREDFACKVMDYGRELPREIRREYARMAVGSCLRRGSPKALKYWMRYWRAGWGGNPCGVGGVSGKGRTT